MNLNAISIETKDKLTTIATQIKNINIFMADLIIADKHNILSTDEYKFKNVADN